MDDLSKLKAIDARLEQACAALQEAVQSVAVVDGQSQASFRRSIADSLRRAWDARSIIHAQAPELTPEFIAQSEQNPEQCTAYLAAVSQALVLSAAGSTRKACATLEAYASSASSTYFAQRARDRALALGGTI
jgi:predicted deacylase